MKQKDDFCLTAQMLEADNGNFRFVFDEPITIQPNSMIRVYWAYVQQQLPQADYKTRGYTIFINLPTYTHQNHTLQDNSAYKKNVFLNIPPQNTENGDTADPGAGIPAVVQTTYEPYNTRVLKMKNQTQQITSLDFQIVDLASQEPNKAGVGFATEVSLAFCIEECGDDNNMY